MATDGPNAPTSVVSAIILDPGGGGNQSGTIEWADPANAIGSDNAYATVPMTTAGDDSQGLIAVHFDFAVPAGAVVTGIAAILEYKSSALGNKVSGHVCLMYQGVAIGAVKDTTGYWPSTDTTQTLGGDGDRWSLGSVPAAVLNDDTFGVGVWVELGIDDATTASLDAITMTVYYVEGGSAMPCGARFIESRRGFIARAARRGW